MSGGDITRLLDRVGAGDPLARNELIALAYAELKQLARGQLRREGHAQVLQPTALVNEAYLRLFGSAPNWENRRHFFGSAVQAMRRVLVDEARRRQAEKRGGDIHLTSLTSAGDVASDASVELLELEPLLEELGRVNERLLRVVELRYFGGLDIEATADLLDIAPATVKRDWAYARAWLLERLQGTREG